jgi:hypothetical protein
MMTRLSRDTFWRGRRRARRDPRRANLGRLTDREFQDGLGRLAADAAAEDPTHPSAVAERYDVAVLSLSCQ